MGGLAFGAGEQRALVPPVIAFSGQHNQRAIPVRFPGWQRAGSEIIFARA